MHRPILSIAPTSQPISLAEAKTHLRVDASDEDTLIQSLILAAAGHLDGYTGLLGRCMITQTWLQKFDDWAHVMRLPFADIQSVVLKYTDDDGTQQTVSSDLYTVYQDARGHYIRFEDEFSDPSVGPDYAGVEATMVCGYGAADDVPAPLRAAMLLHIGTLYEYRETMADNVNPSMAFEALIAPYRRVGV